MERPDERIPSHTDAGSILMIREHFNIGAQMGEHVTA